MKFDKATINNKALEIIKEVITEKKYKNLTEGVIANTSEDMTEEQVKRVLEEVNKKVFTFIYEKREDKNFSFEIASLEKVLESKNYQKVEKENKNILNKKDEKTKVSEKVATFISCRESNFEEVMKAASFILGECKAEGFGKESYEIAKEMISLSLNEVVEEKTASKILDAIKRTKQIITGHDKMLEKNLADKKASIVSGFDEIMKKAFVENIGTANATLRFLPSVLNLKKDISDTQQEIKDSGFTKGQFLKNYLAGNIFKETMMQKQ